MHPFTSSLTWCLASSEEVGAHPREGCGSGLASPSPRLCGGGWRHWAPSAASEALLVGPCLHLQGWDGSTAGRTEQTGTEREELPGSVRSTCQHVFETIQNVTENVIR